MCPKLCQPCDELIFSIENIMEAGAPNFVCTKDQVGLIVHWPLCPRPINKPHQVRLS